MGFLAPWLLGGLALASAPIIIHLLNRRRFIVVDWAPMHYLKLTLRTNRRRLRLEQWLLLLIRTLVIVALFIAVARPLVSGSGLGGLFGGQGRSSRIIVIDDTLSTAARVGGRSAMDRAKSVAAELVEHIGTQDAITVLTASAPADPLVREAHLDDPHALLQQIGELKPTHVAAPWSGVLAGIDPHLAAATFPLREVTLVTDLRAEGWSQQVSRQAQAWDEAGVKLRIIDVGATPAGNAALTGLRQTNAVALVETPVTIAATITVAGGAAPATDQAILVVDGESRPVRLPDYVPGQTHELSIVHTFDKPGQHTVQLTLPDDALPEDNRRSLVIDVKRRLDITLVDGEPGTEPFESETDFLALAMMVGKVPWAIDRQIDSEWLAAPLTAPDVLVLANVAAISDAHAQQVDEMVRAGMGLIVFPGDQTDPATYNAALYRGGKGPLPVALDGVEALDAKGLLVEPLDDSPLTELGALSARVLAGIAPQRVLAVQPIPDTQDPEAGDAARVLAYWDDEDRRPAAIEKRHGRGRVLLFTVTADKAWSQWPTDASYVLAMREAALRLSAGNTARSAGIEAGQPIAQPADPTRPPTRAMVRTPGAAEPAAASIDLADPARVMIRHDQTRAAGIYQLSWDLPGVGEQERSFAVNPSVAESDLTPVEHEQLRSMLAPLDVQIITLGGGQITLAAERIELWRTVAFALLGLVLFESALATFVGRER